MKDKTIKAPITETKFSPTQNKSLAVAYLTGVVTLWDVHSKVIKSKFTAHSQACTDIAFSPVNNMLLCTVGLDEKINFLDIVAGTVVKQISTGVQMSCISFCTDGHTIAVGAQYGGRVLVYDLKEPKKVKLELKGHDKSKSINALHFTRIYKPSTLPVSKLPAKLEESKIVEQKQE